MKGGTRHFYHSIINNSDDSIAIEYGSCLSQNELTFVKDIIQNLVQEKYLSTGDIAQFKPSGMSDIEVASFLDKLDKEYWLEVSIIKKIMYFLYEMDV